MITAGVLFAYQFSAQQSSNEETTRAMVFTTLIFANVFLSLVDRSFVYSMLDSFRNKNRLFPVIIGATLVVLFAILYIPSFAEFFHVTRLDVKGLGISILIAAISVLWFEVYKWIKRNHLRTDFKEKVS
jgi:Ca2+-transporting ATPase